MAEYVIHGETLTAIADAIRAKTSATSDIPTTSMADEILAITTAMPPDGITAITTGSLTPASDINESWYSIPHDLGVVPNFFILYIQNGATIAAAQKPTYLYLVQLGIDLTMAKQNSTKCGDAAYMLGCLRADGTIYVTNYVQAEADQYFTDEAVVIGTNATRQLKTGLTYYWIAGRASNLL